MASCGVAFSFTTPLPRLASGAAFFSNVQKPAATCIALVAFPCAAGQTLEERHLQSLVGGASDAKAEALVQGLGILARLPDCFEAGSMPIDVATQVLGFSSRFQDSSSSLDALLCRVL
eukprot:symbB.v1.2.028192.t1/scaffold2897.1/size67685/3